VYVACDEWFGCWVCVVRCGDCRRRRTWWRVCGRRGMELNWERLSL
jgi:hypothetical protein